MIEILDACGPLLSRYRALICDVWGVLHDGVQAYAATNETLQRYREQGGVVVLLSNSPQPSSETSGLLEHVGVWRSAYDRLITSGDLTEAELQARNLTQVHRLGPERHAGLFAKKSYRHVPLEEAQAIVCTGFESGKEKAEDYAPVLEQAFARKLLFICANPDRIVDVGGTLYPCAGLIADLYEKMGGSVHWAGKPHASAYRAALKAAAELCAKPLGPRDVLVIGDAFATDIKGAQDAGLDALFLAQGIHRKDIAPEGKINDGALRKQLAAHDLKIRAAAFSLTW